MLSAIDLAPASLSAYLTLGGIYSAAGRDGEAAGLYERALAIKDPEGGAELLKALSEQRKAVLSNLSVKER